MSIKSILLIAVLAVSTFLSNAVQAQMNILTGFKNGSYYQMAEDIKSHVDTSLKVVSSEGNYYNFMQLRNLRKNGFDIVFLQYDVLFAGTYGFEDLKKIQNIRALLPLGKEEIHLVAKKDSKIAGLADLAGKKVAVGGINQGTVITARFIQDFTKIKWTNVNITFDESFDALMKGDIDAFFFVGTMPVRKFNNLEPHVKSAIKLVPVSHTALEKVYTKTVIPAGTYDWLTEDVPTISVGFALATNITGETPADIKKLETFLKGIKDNIAILQQEGHPGWKKVDFNFNKINAEVHDVSKKVFGVK